MSDAPIVPYMRPPHVDTVQELRALGLAHVERFFAAWQRIVTRKVDHWNHRTFDEYKKVPIYKAEIEGRFAIYAVEDEADGGIKVSLLLAGTLGDKSIGGQAWDGQDMNFVRDTVVRPRVTDYFG